MMWKGHSKMKIKKFDEITPNKAASFEMLYNSARRMMNRALEQVERDYKQAGITVPESVVYEFLHLSRKLEQMAARWKADQLTNAQTVYKPPMKPLVVGINILKLIPADWRKKSALAGAILNMLTAIYTDRTTLEWWIYRMDFGRNCTPDSMKDASGKPIPIKTLSHLYKYLLENIVDDK